MMLQPLALELSCFCGFEAFHILSDNANQSVLFPDMQGFDSLT